MRDEPDGNGESAAARDRENEGVSDEDFRRFLMEEGQYWLDDPNIVGISLARKIRGGAEDADLAVRFDVLGKLDNADIDAMGTRPIPKVLQIGKVEVSTDVVEGRPEGHGNPRIVNPITGGVSFGTHGDTGTLGAVLRHVATGQPVALSNWHVLANNGGDDRSFQPGPDDGGGHPASFVGRLIGNGVLDMEVDAAITSIETRQVSATISGLGVPVTSVRKPEKGMAVVKSGKETGVTFGIIEATDKLVSYRIWGRPLRHKIYVCAIKPDPARPAQGSFAARGDSGSCWMMVDSNGKPTDQMIGLHVGGDTSLKLAYACIAETVLSKLGLEPLAAT